MTDNTVIRMQDLPLYTVKERNDGSWCIERPWNNGGTERIDQPFSTKGAAVVICATLNSELIANFKAIAREMQADLMSNRSSR